MIRKHTLKQAEEKEKGQEKEHTDSQIDDAFKQSAGRDAAPRNTNYQLPTAS